MNSGKILQSPFPFFVECICCGQIAGGTSTADVVEKIKVNGRWEQISGSWVCEKCRDRINSQLQQLAGCFAIKCIKCGAKVLFPYEHYSVRNVEDLLSRNLVDGLFVCSSCLEKKSNSVADFYRRLALGDKEQKRQESIDYTYQALLCDIDFLARRGNRTVRFQKCYIGLDILDEIKSKLRQDGFTVTECSERTLSVSF